MNNLGPLEESLGYRFQNPDLLRLALTRRIDRTTPNNERLEFLGDAVLDLVVRDYLLCHRPEANEGELTRLKSSMVCEPSLAEVGLRLGLLPYLSLDRSCLPDAPLADAVEAIIGAVFQDGGLEAARSFILSLQLPEGRAELDAKSLLQEKVQAVGGRVSYAVVSQKIYHPDIPEYVMTVSVSGKEIGRGVGRSKKLASQSAAQDALSSLPNLTF